VKALILGGDGMLGHEVLRLLAEHHETRVTLRLEPERYGAWPEFDASNTYFGVDLRYTPHLVDVMADFRPDVVVNAAGVVKQRPDGQHPLPNLEINAVLPHRVATVCRASGARLIHISTDCVFSGERGNYSEADQPSPVDTYGCAKLLGEVVGEGSVTLRTSIIGLELKRKAGLIEWFLSQAGRVDGYRRAIFSGLTTGELSRVIRDLIQRHPGASGLYHLGAAAISKYELLRMVGARCRPDVEITPDDTFRCDRSLDSSKFMRTFGYSPPTWDHMVEELCGQIRAREGLPRVPGRSATTAVGALQH
jgi:dTDP-4-dehydrorhamnose reductase